MKYTLSEYGDSYEVRREGEESVIGFLQRKGTRWKLSIASSCGWLNEEEVKSLTARLSLLNMQEGVATKGENWYYGYRP